MVDDLRTGATEQIEQRSGIEDVEAVGGAIGEHHLVVGVLEMCSQVVPDEAAGTGYQRSHGR
ncbi:MAG: hypothetical protein V9E94_08625 [Microthrixaceae bacterium]